MPSRPGAASAAWPACASAAAKQPQSPLKSCDDRLTSFLQKKHANPLDSGQWLVIIVTARILRVAKPQTRKIQMTINKALLALALGFALAACSNQQQAENA